jgi:hypothetical protein
MFNKLQNSLKEKAAQRAEANKVYGSSELPEVTITGNTNKTVDDGRLAVPRPITADEYEFYQREKAAKEAGTETPPAEGGEATPAAEGEEEEFKL